MQKTIDLEEEKIYEPFQVINGDLSVGGKEPIVGCWLKGLPEGSIFLVRDEREKSFILSQWEILEVFGDAIKLQAFPTGEQVWVDPQWYCNRFKLVEELALVKKEEVSE